MACPLPSVLVMTTTASPAAGGHLRRAAAPALLLNILAPLAAYELLTALGSSQLVALAVGSVFPAAGIAATALRTRRVDGTALVSLSAIVVGLAGGLLFHSAWFLLVQGAFLTGTIGVVFLASLAASRPLVFVIGRQLAAAAERPAFEGLWASPGHRAGMRRMTAIWGAALVVHAACVIALSFVLTPGAVMVASPLLAVVLIGPVGVWTVRRRAARMRSLDPAGRPS
ncbi:MAG: hypothetical protein QOF00_5727 [Pseudonocardiales bacterium]|nr:hypothetical protein [Pseudonocardiales bacterium]